MELYTYIYIQRRIQIKNINISNNRVLLYLYQCTTVQEVLMIMGSKQQLSHRLKFTKHHFINFIICTLCIIITHKANFIPKLNICNFLFFSIDISLLSKKNCLLMAFKKMFVKGILIIGKCMTYLETLK